MHIFIVVLPFSFAELGRRARDFSKRFFLNKVEGLISTAQYLENIINVLMLVVEPPFTKKNQAMYARNVLPV